MFWIFSRISQQRSRNSAHPENQKKEIRNILHKKAKELHFFFFLHFNFPQIPITAIKKTRLYHFKAFIYKMHYKSSCNALIMPRNAHYNVLYDYNNCNHCMSTTNKPSNIIMHFNFGYNYLWKDNALRRILWKPL